MTGGIFTTHTTLLNSNNMSAKITKIPGTNIIINWADISPNCNWVTVDYWGNMKEHDTKPYNSIGASIWEGSKNSNLLDNIAINCYNWQTLIFERPN